MVLVLRECNLYSGGACKLDRPMDKSWNCLWCSNALFVKEQNEDAIFFSISCCNRSSRLVTKERWKLKCGALFTISVTCNLLSAFKILFQCLLQLLSVATFLGAIFCFSAFCFKSMYPFLAFFAVGELLVFATQVLYLITHQHTISPFNFASGG